MTVLSWTDYKKALGDLLKAPLPKTLEAPLPSEIRTDTRKPLNEKWFLPLKGESFNGNTFIEKALQDGALGCFCEESFYSSLPQEIQEKLIVVTNTLEALQRLARYIREKNPSTLIFAVTGSIGKTTTKNLLASILEQTREPVLLAPKNYNNEVGLPLTLLNLSPKHKYAVLEMGARREGDIKLLKHIAKPDINLCLCVGSSHIGVFGSKENIYKAKLEIFEKLVKGQKNILLSDDPVLVEKGKAIDGHCYTFGATKGADALLLSLSPQENGRTAVRMSLLGKELCVSLSSSHKAIALNVLASSLAASLAGVPLNEIQKGLELFSPTEARFKVYKRPNFSLIDDSYNASLESMKAGIDSVELNYPEKKNAFIIGDMLDLGEFSEELHKELADFCFKLPNVNTIVTIGESSSKAFQEASKNKPQSFTLFSYKNIDQFLESKPTIASLGETIYLKGAQAMNLQKAVQYFLNQ